MVAEQLLSGFNCNLTMVGNGQEAIDAWLEKPFDLILMDIQMPVMDGVEAIKKIREIEQEQDKSRIQIIVLTANVLAQQIQEYLAAGADGCVTKPFSEDDLIKAVKQRAA